MLNKLLTKSVICFLCLAHTVSALQSMAPVQSAAPAGATQPGKGNAWVNWASEKANEFAINGAREIQRMQEQKMNRMVQLRANIDANNVLITQLRDTPPHHRNWRGRLPAEEIQMLTNENARTQLQIDELNRTTLQAEATITKVTDMATQVVGDAMAEEIHRETTYGNTAINAEAQKNAAIQKGRDILAFLSNRQNLVQISGAVALAAAGIYAAKEGFRVGGKYLESLIGKPKLVRESSVDTFLSRIKRTVFGVKPPQGNIDEVIVRPELREKLQLIALSTKQARANNDPLMNVLFYGPPGVGKTKYAKELAKYADMEYAIMSGADFSQFKEGEDIAELHKLFDWAERSTKGLLVFIDEADSFLRNRGAATTSQRAINLTNAFLSRVEKQTSQNIMFAFATNHPDVLDSAVLSRIAPANRIEFFLPGPEERSQIFDLYLNKYCRPKKIAVDEQIEKRKSELVAAMNGLSGRDIDGAVTQMIREMRLKEGKTITYDIAYKVIKATVAEKNKELPSLK